jgi:dTDP-4-dehydrorhamnose 3,5-epimerase
MTFTATPIAGCYIVQPTVIADSRGWFARTFCKNEFEQIRHTAEWVQMNHSFTQQKGAIRGLHFQYPPFGEIKLVRCIAGAVYDVVLDLRKDSSSFLQWFGVELSADNRSMLYIPKGLAHGFQVLKENSELIYHHSEFYKSGNEGGVRYNDPLIGIQWPLAVNDISIRDQQHDLLDKNFKGI